MKFFKSVALAICAFCVAFACVACGQSDVRVTLGTYSEANQTFTPVTEGYSLSVSGTTFTLKGEIPYSEGTLGLEAGNIVAIKIMPTTEKQPDSGTSIQTTNRQSQEGWNTYGQEALEQDGSIIWVTSVTKDEDAQIKIKWNSESEEKTYTLKVDNSATLATAGE